MKSGMSGNSAPTATGLRVTVSILDKVYATGRKYAEGFEENMPIVFAEHQGKKLGRQTGGVRRALHAANSEPF